MIAKPLFAFVFAALPLAAPVRAGVQNAGSLLVFPVFDNSPGSTSIVSVTNTNGDAVTGQVRVHFVYVNGSNCQEFDRVRTLTPNDTITVLTKYDNPNQTQGYLYCFALNKLTGAATKFDYLVGTEIVGTASDALDTETQPFVFRAGNGLAEGANTDLDGDGIRDLNGNEYEPAPNRILVPNFIASTNEIGNKLVLINLTGGAAFTASVGFEVYNDNEEIYSGQYSFSCWTKVDLLSVSNVFANWFLKSTNHNPNEIEGTNDLAPETGWFRLNGLTASSSTTTFSDPAILAMRLTQVVGRPNLGIQGLGSGIANDGFAALPYGEGTQTNGDLLPHGTQGDGN